MKDWRSHYIICQHVAENETTDIVLIGFSVGYFKEDSGSSADKLKGGQSC